MTIAHRFALIAPGGWHVPGATAWDAHDTRLDSRVVLLVADAGDADAVLARLTRVRGVRDPRLARIVDVGIADVAGGDESGSTGPRAYVAVAALTGLTIEAMLEARLLPASLARLLVRSAADALDGASALGLAHGALSSTAMAVNNRGRLIVAGAGLAAAFGGDARSADAADARVLAGLFTRAVLGFDTADEDEDEEFILPEDLTAAESRLVTRSLRGKALASVADVLAALGSSDGASLSGLPAQLRTFPAILAAEPEPLQPEVLEPEVLEPGVLEPGVLEPGVLEPGAVQLDESQVARATEAAPRGATRAEIEEWELEHLLEEQEAEEIPTLAEAFLDLLHRRFPGSARITGYLEAAHARALRVPKVNGTKWTVLVLLLLLAFLGYTAVGLYKKPFVPSYDLNNPPAQTYPAFTFYPSVTPSPVTPAP